MSNIYLKKKGNWSNLASIAYNQNSKTPAFAHQKTKTPALFGCSQNLRLKGYSISGHSVSVSLTMKNGKKKKLVLLRALWVARNAQRNA